MATYCAKNHLLTPRKGRRKLRKPVQVPSKVLLWTSRIPSPSSSRAHSRWPGVWHTWPSPRPVSGTWLYACHSSVYSIVPSPVVRSTKFWSVSRSACLTTSRRTCPESRPTTPATGGRSFSHVPCPRTLLPRRRGGSSGSGCGIPFFPRILVHLVGLRDRIGQGALAEGLPSQGVPAMAQEQQLHAIALQFSRQLGRRRPLGNAPQNQPHGRWPTRGAFQDRARPGIEHPTTRDALVVQHRLPMPAMDPQPPTGPAAWAHQTVGVQKLQQFGVTSSFIHDIEKWKIHPLPP